MQGYSPLVLLALTVLPHLIGLVWALVRRTELGLIVAIVIQRIGFIVFFSMLLTDVNRHSPQTAPFTLMFLLLAVGNTAMLLEVMLMSAGLRRKKL